MIFELVGAFALIIFVLLFAVGSYVAFLYTATGILDLIDLIRDFIKGDS